jgi:hypothetical protein
MKELIRKFRRWFLSWIRAVEKSEAEVLHSRLTNCYKAMPLISVLSQNPNNVLVFSNTTVQNERFVSKNVFLFGENIRVRDCDFLDLAVTADSCCDPYSTVVENCHFQASMLKDGFMTLGSTVERAIDC